VVGQPQVLPVGFLGVKVLILPLHKAESLVIGGAREVQPRDNDHHVGRTGGPDRFGDQDGGIRRIRGESAAVTLRKGYVCAGTDPAKDSLERGNLVKRLEARASAEVALQADRVLADDDN